MRCAAPGCRIRETPAINAALQALARPLLSSRFDLETGALAAQAADSALHAAPGLFADRATWRNFATSPQPYALSTPAPATPRRYVFPVPYTLISAYSWFGAWP